MNALQLNRLTYPRVSEIIAVHTAAAMRAIPIDCLANASIRGTAVHQYCTAFMKNLFLPEIEEEYQPYVGAFVVWANENVVSIIDTSKRLYDDEMKFSGEFDAVVILKDSDQPILLDIKTSCLPSKTWPIQLAAYKHLCEKNGMKIDRIMNLHLKKSKKVSTEEIEGQKVKVSVPIVCAKEIRHEDITSAWEIFSSALRCYDYFERREVS